tara:strand:+ start:153 stop:341 length:189 start_codon:yes stop_codon:yes gene_type:complete
MNYSNFTTNTILLGYTQATLPDVDLKFAYTLYQQFNLSVKEAVSKSLENKLKINRERLGYTK